MRYTICRAVRAPLRTIALLCVELCNEAHLGDMECANGRFTSANGSRVIPFRMICHIFAWHVAGLRTNVHGCAWVRRQLAILRATPDGMQCSAFSGGAGMRGRALQAKVRLRLLRANKSYLAQKGKPTANENYSVI